jgi:serine/threonine protein kinase
MGIVFRARHTGLHRDVAVKIIASSLPGFAERFRLEAAALGRLKHPHIVDVMDFGIEEARGLAYLVMELLEGSTLAARCESRRLDVTEALPILEQVAEAVDFAHEQGILHRDLKPANIFIVRSGAAESIKIVDFGLAHFLRPDGWEFGARESEGVTPPDLPPDAPGDTTTRISPVRVTAPLDRARGDLLELQEHERATLMGTHAYMAPELFRLETAAAASDIYALGVVGYQLLTGSLPRRRERASESPPAPSSVNGAVAPELDAPLLRLLDADPERRPPTARRAVEAIAAGHRAARVREWRTRERPRRTIAASAIGLFVVVGALLETSPPIRRLETHTIDARFALAAPRPPHPDILLVVLDNQSVDADARPLSLRADEFGATLDRMFDAGARAVAVDLLLPQVWSTSAPFARVLARHTDRLTLSAVSTASGTVLGPECLPPLVLELVGSERARELFGFVNLDSDDDGVTRHVRGLYRDAANRLQPTWAARAASAAGASVVMDPGRDRVDYTVDATRLRRVSWLDAARLADAAPDTFRDRIVLVGGEFTGSGDEHQPLPGRANRGRPVSGLVVQALIVNTIVNGFPIREAGRWPVFAGAGVVGGVLAFRVLTKARPGLPLGMAIALAGAYTATAFAAFASTRVLWPVAVPVLVVIFAAAAAMMLRWSWGAPPQES